VPLRWAVPALLILVTVGLGSVVPAPRAGANVASIAHYSTSSSESADPVAAYVVNEGKREF
jgi:hypothetical protein